MFFLCTETSGYIMSGFPTTEQDGLPNLCFTFLSKISNVDLDYATIFGSKVCFQVTFV